MENSWRTSVAAVPFSWEHLLFFSVQNFICFPKNGSPVAVVTRSDGIIKFKIVEIWFCSPKDQPNISVFSGDYGFE